MLLAPTSLLYQRPTIRFLAKRLAQDEDAAAQQMTERLAKQKGVAAAPLAVGDGATSR